MSQFWYVFMPWKMVGTVLKPNLIKRKAVRAILLIDTDSLVELMSGGIGRLLDVQHQGTR